MTEELKPCPFCGEDCAVLNDDFKWAGYQPSCLEVRTGYDSSENAPWRPEAITAWNTRAPDLTERAAIVAWLRREEADYPASQYSGFAAMIAEEIEAGEHHDRG